MKKRLLSLGLAVCLMTTCLVGCKEQKATPKKNETKTEQKKSELPTKVTKKTEITFWHAMSGVNEEAIQKITDDFMKKNPNIKVTLVNQGGYMDLFDKLMAAAKAKQLPTMTQIYSNRLSWYISKDLVCDLNPYMDDAKTGFTNAEKEDIPVMFLDDGLWNDKQYALPLNKSQMVMYFNKGMFEEQGLEIPKTWEEWRIACEKMTKMGSDGNPEVYGCVFENNISTDIAPWVVQAGGMTMDEEDNKVLFDTQPMKEAVTFLDGLFKNKLARFAGDDQHSNVPIQDGRTAMCVASTSALPFIEEGTKEGIEIMAAPLPGDKNDRQLYYGTNVAVFNQATDMQKQAAWEYIKFLTNTENTAYFAAKTGYIPVRKSAAETDIMKEVLKEKPIKRVPFECFDRGFQGTRNIGGKNALDELGKQLELVFSGEKSIDDALKDAQKNGQKALEDAKSN